MAEPTKKKTRGSCLGKLFFLMLLALACGFGIAVFFITQPQDLSDIDGYGPLTKAVPDRDMKAVLKNSIDRGYPLTLTEMEINQWLGRKLMVKQGGLLAGVVSLERVWVRLTDGQAELVMERKILGRPFTVSMFLQIEQTQSIRKIGTEVLLHGGPYHELLPRPTRGGRFGKLVMPQGFLIMVLPAYQKLAAVFTEEIHLGFEEMARITIEKKLLVLNPRAPSSGPENLPQTF
jgi:hypothetical protein